MVVVLVVTYTVGSVEKWKAMRKAGWTDECMPSVRSRQGLSREEEANI